MSSAGEVVVARDRKTLTELSDARRLFQEIGLSDEAAEVTALQQRIEQRGSREFATLYEVGKVISSILDLDVLLERITDLAIESLEAERGLIILIDEDTGEHKVVTARDVEKETEADAIQFSQSAVSAAASGRPIFSGNAVGDDRFAQFKSVSLYEIKSFMCVPMQLRERVIGTVYVDSRRLDSQFDQEDVRFLEAFAGQAALAIENARLMRRLREENHILRQVVSSQYGFDAVVGRSAALKRVLHLLAKAAVSDTPILLTGESGTGKELFAKSIHVASTRGEGPFVAVNCAAIPAELLESELFGHARGAFSGADREKKGLLETAENGTFFFDEIGEMVPALQAKLLRAVEEGTIRRVGETKTRRLNIRIISATNANLKQDIADGRFREDLYYRLNVVSVRLPPLRERVEDILPLAEHFLRLTMERGGRRFDGFSRETAAVLQVYPWPGNVRELENVVERGVALSDGPRIGIDDLPEEVAGYVAARTDDAVGGAVPTGVSSELRAAHLWSQLIEQKLSFWDVVREPFLRRELSREDVRSLVERGLNETTGSYKRLAELFQVGEQYKKFHAFLKNNGCHIARGRFAREI